jgi:hypothetical protein
MPTHPLTLSFHENRTLSAVVKRLRMKTTTHLHLILSLRMPSWRQQCRNLQDQNLNKKSFQQHPSAFEAQKLCSHPAGLYMTRNRTADLYETCCVTID